MGNRDVVDSNFRMRGSASHIVEMLPGAGLAFGAWSSVPAAHAGMRGVPFMVEGASGVADVWGLVLKGADETYTAVTVGSADGPTVVSIGNDAAASINTALLAVKAPLGASVGGGEVYLPRGELECHASVVLQNRTGLVGQGQSTILKAGDDLGGPVVTNASQGDRFVRLERLRIDGNKSGQTDPTDCHGIAFDMDDIEGDEYADAYWRLREVVIVDCADRGVFPTGRGEGMAYDVVIRDCSGEGWYHDAPDCSVYGLRISGCGKAGLVINGSNNDVYGFKAFHCGLIDGSVGYGLHILDGNVHNTIFGGQVQDNNNHGALVEGSKSMLLGFTADSNNAGLNGDAERNANGIQVVDASNVVITAICRDRDVNTHKQKHALGVTTAADGLTADIKSSGHDTGHLAVGTISRMNIRVNNYGSRTSLAYAASVTPDPTAGNYIVVGTLTGNITVNAPATTNRWAGCEMTLQFTQDGTGNHTVSFGAGFRTNFTATATAGRTSTVTAVFDGADWVQTGSQLDIT